MKRIRFGAWIAVTAMLSVSLGVNVYANSDVPVMVGNNTELYAAAQDSKDGSIIMLTDNIKLSSGISFDVWAKDITLDVNGYNLLVEDDNVSAIRMEGWDGSLTLTDSKGGGMVTARCLYEGEAKNADTSGIRVEGKAQSLIIDDVEVVATGGNFGPGIGASAYDVGKIVIKSGVVTADGGNFGAGIGGGLEQFAGDIEIYDGVITATGGNFASAIGTGGFTTPKTTEKNNSVYITGGYINATGGNFGAGIGGGQLASADVWIDDGKVIANGGNFGAGIGTGKMNIASSDIVKDFAFDESKVYITGGNILAKGGSFAAGIGMGEGAPDYGFEEAWSNRTLKIDGGNVIAYGGENGAGIGGGAYFSGGNIEIAQTDAVTYIEAYGGASAAGIGGGLAGLPGAMVTIYDGTVFAGGGENGAGIGSGEFGITRLEPSDVWAQSVKNISIVGGNIEAVAGENAAAIGGGNCGSGAYVTVGGNPTVVAVSSFENTIGAGMYATSQGYITIDGGNVRVNNDISSEAKNSFEEDLSLKTLRVVAADGVSPVKNTEIVTKLGHYSYPAVTNEQGYAYVYLPQSEEAAVQAFAPDNTFIADISAVQEDISEIVLADYEPIEILSKEYVYFLDSNDNTYQIDYRGNNVTFDIDDGKTGITIEPKTGLLTFPVQLRQGEYTININAYSDDELADASKFVLTVKESGFRVGMNEKEKNIDINTKELLSLAEIINEDDIREVYWKVTSGDESGCVLEKLDNPGEVNFTAFKAGDYSITATVVDKYNNQSSDTVAVKAVDPFAFDYTAVAVANLGLPTIEDIENTETPRITGWSVYRNSPEKVEVVFRASKKGEYYYAVVPSGEGALDEEFEGSFIAWEGLNNFEHSGLNPEKEYDVHIKLVDVHKQESPEKVLYVNAFETPDIVPPSLAGFHIDRGIDFAELTFTSDKPGMYRYAMYENGIAAVSTVDNYTFPSELTQGENKIIFENLNDENEYEVYIFAEDGEYNRTPDYRFTIEPFEIESVQVQDEAFRSVAVATDEENYVKTVLTPKLQAVEVAKPSDYSAMVTVISNTDCEYYVVVAPEEKGFAPVDIYGSGLFMSEGENGVLVSDILPNVAYQVGIVGKNANGDIGEPVFAKIPAQPIFEISEARAKRITNSTASLYFESEADGIIYYTAVEKDMPVNEGYEYKEVLYEGNNRVVLDNLEPSVEYDAYVLAIDGDGNYSNPVRVNISSNIM